ncbi:MAG: virulence-associated E family protein [Alicyclobacillus macrosporangiidus]|uniref:virulence-associated E family protein n=1 Tax=Alicyclobacillus macrosporangiidus TaxID=392015 RepID=UPI0026EB577A|nr:virulence-associated E family protein [Alicyclobacillus macrosporangiidus]MCL6598977.1 virulence-associated E family protein [Alicyclobacillus macrosporangiidus]
MQYDRQLTISAAGSRKATHWPAQTVYWSELVERLRVPWRGTETLAEYLKLRKDKQDELKDIGGFVGGYFHGNRRKAAAVAGRDLITLDLDAIPAGGTQDVLRRLEALGCAYVVYSTRKHEEAKPRLRVLIPLNRTATADEYEPLARRMAAIIGIELCDPTTFEASRLMYWPSCCADSQYVYQYADKPFVDVDGLLATYQDWHDVSEWPQVPGAQDAHVKRAAKQADPTSKTGVVGAFCKVYDIYRAMETFLPGVYAPTDDPDRYTYTGGSTTGGAIVYDNGLYLYSHHATDPAGGRLVNAWDLVRLHLYGELDDEANPDTPPAKRPSWVAMKQLALRDEKVAALLDQERYERVQEAFSTDAGVESGDDGTNWLRLLDRNPNTGMPEKSARNVQIVLEHDPALRGRIYLDSFADRIMGIAPLPWGRRREQSGPFVWDDYDDDGLCVYLEALLKMSNTNMVRMALRDHAAKHARNPVAEYLTSLEWDGVPRLDTLYIDYLGAEDCEFVRAVTRKAFVAAVARAMTDEGVKFDTMTVICGPQNLGKSTLFRKLGKRWFSDSIKSFEGKEAEELIQGRWIVEIAELQGFNKVDVNRIKQFLSKIDDQYRAAYGRHVKTQVRRCVFFGTTNDHEYLRDPTGNRRFWPVDALVQEPTKSVFDDLTEAEVDQIWAEAVMRWRLGEPVYLSKEMEEEAKRRRESHMESDPLQGQIEEFLERHIPEDWHKWSIDRRMMFWNGQMQVNNAKLVPRDRVCALEIWRECLGERRTMTKADARRINEVLQQMPGWVRSEPLKFGADYGKQRGFMRAAGALSMGNIPAGGGNILPLRATFQYSGTATN